MFKEDLPREYEQARRLLEQFRRRSVTAVEAATGVRRLLSNHVEAGGAFEQLLEHHWTKAPERPEKIERVERPEKPEKPEKPERLEKPERPEKTERPERVERPERTDRAAVRRFVERAFPILEARFPAAIRLLNEHQSSLRWDDRTYTGEADFAGEVLASLRRLGLSPMEPIEALFRELVGPAERPPSPKRRVARVVEEPVHEEQGPEEQGLEPPSPSGEAEALEPPLRLLADLQARLSATELAQFAQYFHLFWRNVLSFAEFRDLAEELGMKIGKEVLASLKAAVDQREQHRISSSPFNVKTSLTDVQGPLNRSYKRIDPLLPFNTCTGPLINKAYQSIATGTENNSNDGDARSFAKFPNEVALLNSEDQMHEFDSTSAQLRFAISALEASPENRPRLLARASNTGIFGAVFGSLASEVVRSAVADVRVAEFAAEALRARLAGLRHDQLETFEPAWHKAIDIQYYRALDVRANAVRQFERRTITSKALLAELRAAVPGAARLTDSVRVLMSLPAENLPVPAHPGKLWAPAFALRLASPEALADALELLRAYAWIKGGVSEKERALLMLDRIGEQFLAPAPLPHASLASLLLDESPLQQAAEYFERLLHPSKPFFLAPRSTIDHNRSKATELAAKLRTLPSWGRRTPSETESSPSNPTRAYETRLTPDAPHRGRLFFGQNSFFLAFKYLLMLCDRFEHARQVSLSHPEAEPLYSIFKRALLMLLFEAMEPQAFEDLMRAFFDLYAGPFLSLDRIITAFLKNPNDDLTGFVFTLNADIFEKRPPILPEHALFARTCARQAELLSTASRSAKSTDHDPPELLKFELIEDPPALLIHKLRSLCSGPPNCFRGFLEDNEQILVADHCPGPESVFRATTLQFNQSQTQNDSTNPGFDLKSSPHHKIARNEIRALYVPKARRTLVTMPHAEDILLARPRDPQLDKKRELARAKTLRFADKLTRLRAKREEALSSNPQV